MWYLYSRIGDQFGRRRADCRPRQRHRGIAKLQLRPKTNGAAINIGAADATGVLGLTDAELDRVAAGSLQIGDLNSGTLTVSADVTRPTATATKLISGFDILISSGQVNTGGGTLLLDSGPSPAVIRPIKSGIDVVASALLFAGNPSFVINDHLCRRNVSSVSDTAIIRLLTDGSLDISFDGDGKAVTDVGMFGGDGANDVDLASNGDILLAGFLFSSNREPNTYIARLGGDPTTLRVTSSSPTSAGVRFTLSQPAAIAGVLNLYDFRDTAGASVMGAADVQLIGQTGGAVAGSLMVAPGGTTFTFVATNGVLLPDNYTLTLRSASNGFKTSGGQLLDGNADGTVGDDFTTTFTVAAPPVNAVTVSLPSFARGPQQTVNVPESSTLGLPLRISSGSNLVSMTFELQFDSGLLNVTDITLAAGLTGSKSFSLLSPGRAQVTLTFTTPLTGGSQTVANFTANVPTSAANRYGERGVLDLTNISLTAFGAVPIPALDQDAAHVNAYFGDVSRDGGYNSFDVQQVSRAAVGLDTGYQQHLLLDPRIISDFDGSAGINSFDVQRVSRLAVGLSIPEAPPLPVQPVTVNSTGNLTAEESVDKPTTPPAGSASQHNAAPGLRSDVDNDGIIDAQDILWAVYLYNRSLNDSATSSDASATNLFADVNNDRQLDPADILFAVMDFNLQSTGEGESAVETTPRAASGSIMSSKPAEDLDAFAVLLSTDWEAVRKKK